MRRVEMRPAPCDRGLLRVVLGLTIFSLNAVDQASLDRYPLYSHVLQVVIGFDRRISWLVTSHVIVDDGVVVDDWILVFMHKAAAVRLIFASGLDTAYGAAVATWRNSKE